MTNHYGLWQYGAGTGVYRPTSTTEKAENVITSSAMKYIKRSFPDAFVTKIHGGGYQKAGLPDIYVSIRGRSIWIEMKRPGADTTALQKDKMEQLAKTGAFCGTADSSECAAQIIHDALLEIPKWG